MFTSYAAASGGEESITCNLLVWTPSEDQSPDYGNWIQTQCDAFAKEHPNWNITFLHLTIKLPFFSFSS